MAQTQEWDGHINGFRCGGHKFKNYVPNETLTLTAITKHCNDFYAMDNCLVCKEGPFGSTYEIKLEWGETGKSEYISEVCYDCLETLHSKHISYLLGKSGKRYENKKYKNGF